MEWMPILLLGLAAMLTAILVLRLPRQGWMLFAAVLTPFAGAAAVRNAQG